ncbi:MAG: hypothetical protein JWL90_1912 [Chthoniobacteraceae bacterium]|nr:hypothetical protein [Chthoniobacteraceae bacterium]
MTREFFITSDMIRLSSRQSPTTCPVGLALKAEGVDVHEVGYNFISCAYLGREFLIPLPSACFEFLRRHDSGESVEPISFSITFLEEAPRPLPARFAPKPMPKAPPLPVHHGVHPFVATALSTLKRIVKKNPITASAAETLHFN